MGKSNLGCLLGHGFRDFFDAVTDVNDGGLTGCIEILFTIGRDDPGTFAAKGDGERFLEVARENGGRVCGHSEEIVASRKR